MVNRDKTQLPIDFTNEGFRKAFLSPMERGEPGFPVPPPKLPSIFVNEKDRAYVDSKLTPQPVGTYAQAITLSGAREKIAKTTVAVQASIRPRALAPRGSAYAAAVVSPASRRPSRQVGAVHPRWPSR
jgi:hypothetical protein